MDLSSIQIQSALIAGAVSILIWLLSLLAEPLKSHVTHYLKLKLEHKYNEQKKLKISCLKIKKASPMRYKTSVI